MKALKLLGVFMAMAIATFGVVLYLVMWVASKVHMH